jgi:hypothetical protein
MGGSSARAGALLEASAWISRHDGELCDTEGVSASDTAESQQRDARDARRLRRSLAR